MENTAALVSSLVLLEVQLERAADDEPATKFVYINISLIQVPVTSIMHYTTFAMIVWMFEGQTAMMNCEMIVRFFYHDESVACDCFKLSIPPISIYRPQFSPSRIYLECRMYTHARVP